MKSKLILVLFLFVFIGTVTGAYRESEKNKGSLSKVNTNDLDDYIAINQIMMYFSNNGMGSFNRIADGSGLFWPGGLAGAKANKTAIFRDGLIWGGKVGTEIRVGGNTYRDGLQAGPIINGKPADPSDTKYRIYKIRRNWETESDKTLKDRLRQDYMEWPVDDGAPWVDVDGDKIYTAGIDQPQFIGDEVNWMVMNDMDPARTTFLYGTQPMGMEVQVTVFGFDRQGVLGNMVFKKYKFINKGNSTIRDMVVAYWSDPDLGVADDDYVGCDTVLSLGYVYNGDDNDGVYGQAPPAAGYDFFQGPVIPYDPAKFPIITEKNLPDSAKFDGKWIKGKTNLPLTSFSFYINGHAIYQDPDLGTPNGAIQMYNYMTSKLWNGQPFLDPTRNSIPVNFCLYGDPNVQNSGWYEGGGWPSGQAPGDRRFTMSSGPFTMAPGDTQEVVVAVLVARGNSNLNSVAALKETDKAAQTAYDLDFKLTPPPPAPTVTTQGLDRRIILSWKDNAEGYHEVDPLLTKNGVKYYYDFQGYEVYQYRDDAGTDPVLLATYDLADNIGKILDVRSVEGENVLLPSVVGNNTGIFRTFQVTTDAYTGKAVNNGTPYYFGVVAYGHQELSAPKVLKSAHTPIEILPQQEGVDKEFSFDFGDYIDTKQTVGTSDGIVKAFVFDPEKLTGDRYQVKFKVVPDPTDPTNPTKFKLFYSLINATKGDTLLRDRSDVLTLNDLNARDLSDRMFQNKFLVDGLVVSVSDPGSYVYNQEKRIKEVALIQENGNKIEPKGEILPFVNRIGDNAAAKSAKRGWWLAGLQVLQGPTYFSDMQAFNKDKAIGEDDYEIHFVSQKHPYYLSKFGRQTNYFQDNSLASDSINIEFYNVGTVSNPKKVRHYVKIFEGDVRGKMPPADNAWKPYQVDWTRLEKDTVAYDELYFMNPPVPYADPLPLKSGTSKPEHYPVGKVTLMAKSANPEDLPKPGTIVKITTWKSIKDGDTYEFVATKPKMNDNELAKNNLDKVNVYPNPYFGFNALERDKYNRFVKFTNLPNQVTIRVYNVAGVFIKNIIKNDKSQFAQWDLRNEEGLPVASGMYLAYIDMPGIGTKILKIAVIQEKQYIDRL